MATHNTPDHPIHVNVNGMFQVSINIRNSAGQVVSMAPNTERFTLLAAAINTGIKIIESPAGRKAFAASGRDVVAGWAKQYGAHGWSFWGNTKEMEHYVNVFLQKTRQDLPLVFISNLSSPDVIAQYRRTVGDVAHIRGAIANYRPKMTGAIYFNAARVGAMVRAAGQNDKKHRERYLDFHFLFAAATAHELMHAFVALLGGVGDAPHTYTPPETTHLDYGDSTLNLGESGRYMENILFGGSLEIYRDPNDDDDQCGVIHRLDSHAIAKKLSVLNYRKIVRHEEFKFPIPTQGDGITQTQRMERNMRSLGSIQPHSMAIAGPSTSMKAKGEAWYNLTAEELKEVVSNNRRALTIRSVEVKH